MHKAKRTESIFGPDFFIQFRKRKRGSYKTGRLSTGSEEAYIKRPLEIDLTSMRTRKLTPTIMVTILQKNCRGREEPIKLIVSSLFEVVRKAILAGKTVILPGIASLEPYIKQSSVFKHPTTGRIQTTPERAYLRMNLAVDLKKELRSSGIPQQ